jgi:hypothetical protein
MALRVDLRMLWNLPLDRVSIKERFNARDREWNWMFQCM